MFPRINNFTSKTTTWKECFGIKRHSKDSHDWRNDYHNKIKEMFGVKYAYSFSAGRTALYSILKSIDVQAEDEVIIQAYTCSVVPKAVILSGAKPVYVDINPKDYSLNFDCLKKKISSKTRVVIIQHTYGIPCTTIDEVMELCHKKGILVIEDCAHCLGGHTSDGRMLGTIGDAAFFSTDHTKVISTSIGGFAITNDSSIGACLCEQYSATPEMSDKEIYAVNHQLGIINFFYNKYVLWLWQKCHGFSFLLNEYYRYAEKKGKIFFMEDYTNLEFPSKYVFPAKLSNGQAWVGLQQLLFLTKNIEERKIVVERYRRMFPKEYVIPLNNSFYLRLPILYDNREVILERLEKVCRTEIWFDNLLECVLEENLQLFGIDSSEYPIANKVSNNMVNFPVHGKISEKEIMVIGQLIKT